MIGRYSRPEMARIWDAPARYAKWLEVEIAVVEARARRGEIPADALARIKAKARVEAGRIEEIEGRVKHDVIAFLENLEEAIGEDSRYVHVGMTSSDVLDTSVALQLQEASTILLRDLERLREVLRRLAIREKDTVMVGRTHGIHAEITTFGLKVAVWCAETERDLERLRRAKEAVRVGKLSGAVGTYAHLDPALEAEVCRALGLEPAPVSTQILQRDRHAEYLTTLAIIGASLEKFATEIRNLQRSEILEVEEPFGEGQKGSSAMPHKRNPVGCEQICGLARLLRTNALASMDNIALWHERDISHSSVERVILPDSTILLDYLLQRMTAILEGLHVYPERMRENIERSYGLVFSERVLLALGEKGLSRQRAYELTQRCAMRAWSERRSFEAILSEDQEVTAVLGPEGLGACFDPAWPLRHVDQIFRRLGLLG
ncbi:MAG: adenylosuccinate lyase [Candidatus Rokubacteria bacterium]|nr:adenylosuccinate lyase [Candidatus Rokubacteria bacterium]